MALVDQLQSLSPATPKGVYKILQGRTNIYNQRDQMIARAQKSVDWACSYGPTLHHDEVSGALDLLLERASQGIRTRVLTRAAGDVFRHFEESGRSVDVREFATDTPVRFCIIDGKELLMWVMNDVSESLYAEDDVAIYTSAPGFVAAQEQFLATAWERAPAHSST
jgi:hypothetical protein